MFRAAYRSSSGALTVFAASGLHTHVLTALSQVSDLTKAGQRLQIQLELLMISGVPFETC
jgi:conjugal transfer/entry exclusion protein